MLRRLASAMDDNVSHGAAIPHSLTEIQGEIRVTVRFEHVPPPVFQWWNGELVELVD
jgi:hypothetical protein